MIKSFKVFLDAGHGGKDPGALGNNLKEKDINLSVILKVGEILKKHNIDVVYSRTTDVFLELHERTRKANTTKANVFVSVHCNSASNPLARGVETFHYAISKESAKLAKAVQGSLVATKLYSANRGVKTANFHVIRASNMPAALVELGFINNVDDAKILKNKQDQMANAVAKGILSYLGVSTKTSDDVQKDNQYEKAVKELMLLDIIGSPAAWLNLDKVTVNNMKSLIIKFARKIDSDIKDYNGAVDVLVGVKIISNTQAWAENNINVKNAVPLIIKMSAYMTQGV